MPLPLWWMLVLAAPVLALGLFSLITFRVRFGLRVALGRGRLELSLRIGPVVRQMVLPPSPAPDAARSAPARKIWRPGRGLATAIVRLGVRILGSVRVLNLSWRSDIGLGDAARVARATGLLWAVKSAGVSALIARGKLESRPRVQVTPRFNVVALSTSVECIALIRGSDMITALAAAGYAMLKRQKEVGFKWPRHHIPSKA